MEQIIGTFGINGKLILIQVVNFGLLLFLLHRFLYKPLAKIIDERKEKIEKGVENAEEAENNLKKAKQKSDEILSDAAKEAEKAVISARKAGQAERAEIVESAEERGQAMLLRATKQAEEERIKIIKEGESEIAKLAILAAEKILKDPHR